MGGWWQLEVFKMCLYMAFPVGFFHYFNTLDESEYLKVHKFMETSPEELQMSRKMVQDSIREHNQKYEQERLEAMKRSVNNNPV